MPTRVLLQARLGPSVCTGCTKPRYSIMTGYQGRGSWDGLRFPDRSLFTYSQTSLASSLQPQQQPQHDQYFTVQTMPHLHVPQTDIRQQQQPIHHQQLSLTRSAARPSLGAGDARISKSHTPRLQASAEIYQKLPRQHSKHRQMDQQHPQPQSVVQQQHPQSPPVTARPLLPSRSQPATAFQFGGSSSQINLNATPPLTPQVTPRPHLVGTAAAPQRQSSGHRKTPERRNGPMIWQPPSLIREATPPIRVMRGPSVSSTHEFMQPRVMTAVEGASPTRKYHFARPRLAGFMSKNSSDSRNDTPARKDDALRIFNRIDIQGQGAISKFDLVNAMARDSTVSAFVLPGIDVLQFFNDESSFHAVVTIMDAMFGSKKRIKASDFASYFDSGERTEGDQETDDVRAIFDLIDGDRNGFISKFDFMATVQSNPMVCQFVLPGFDNNDLMSDEWSFDAVDAMFTRISGGENKIYFADFQKHFMKDEGPRTRPRSRTDRFHNKVFIVGPGFGAKINPRQSEIVEQAHFEVCWCHDVPNPETPDFHVSKYLGYLKEQIDQFQPDLLMCASKGGVYAVGLWHMGYWRGPTVLLNAHPSCKKLPEGMPVVIAHGSNDEVYPTSRETLEELIQTGTANKCFLYYTADSGVLSTGHYARRGDSHNMASLLAYDCLPRLIDAALSPDGPEVYIVKTWKERLSEERLIRERKLGYRPDQLLRPVTTTDSKKRRSTLNVLKYVPNDSEEFDLVNGIFKATPTEPPTYILSPQETWDQVKITRLERVENWLQLSGSTKPYYDSIKKSVEEQGIEFDPGVHTCWAFHGTKVPGAIESVTTNPVAGFQPLAGGSAGASLWGSGVYFARDAKYVADGGFCGPAAPDGSRQMLMCLLIIGMPCLGGPEQKGVLPVRRKPHRYHSTVDSLSSPEIFILQHPGAAYAAYLITFA